ncbi:hypothetical protein LCGC14_2643950, partial [marine sediment metagenome]
YLHDNHRQVLRKGKTNQTKHLLRLKNNSVVRCKAVGATGVGIRGFTIDLLIADEAAFMPEDVWAAVTPMLLTTGGDIILISTPKSKSGYFYDSYMGDGFKTFHVNSVEVMDNRLISESWNEKHKTNAQERLAREQDRMTKNQFAQEYLGQFIDDINQFFPDELIKKAMALEFSKEQGIKEFYLGVDVARMGGDESVFEVLERQKNDTLNHIINQKMTKVYLTETTNHILRLDEQYKFKKIYIDDGGLGVGVFDYILENPKTKRRVVAINNAFRVIEYDAWKTNPRRKKLLKVDLYNNLLSLMEKGKISLLNTDDVFLSLKSIQYEHFTEGTLAGTMKIYGDYTHIVEGLIRAAWCVKDKSLKLSISYI